jgi:hypothetical protein
MDFLTLILGMWRPSLGNVLLQARYMDSRRFDTPGLDPHRKKERWHRRTTKHPEPFWRKERARPGGPGRLISFKVTKNASNASSHQSQATKSGYSAIFIISWFARNRRHCSPCQGSSTPPTSRQATHPCRSPAGNPCTHPRRRD